MNWKKNLLKFKEKFSPIEKDFRTIYQLTDPRFGEIRLLESREQKNIVLMRIDSVSSNEMEANKKVKEALVWLELQHPNLLHMVDYSFKTVKVHSLKFELQGFFEYPNWDLQREIEDRKKDMSLFPPDEVLLILQSGLSALAYLQSKKTVHGDLRPKYLSLRNSD